MCTVLVGSSAGAVSQVVAEDDAGQGLQDQDHTERRDQLRQQRGAPQWLHHEPLHHGAEHPGARDRDERRS